MGQDPASSAALRLAESAMEIFCEDLRQAGSSVAAVSRAPGSDDSTGRFGFAILLADGTVHQIQMPGRTLQQVRYLGPPHHAGAYPRLYVNGSSWLWLFAVGICSDPAAAQETGDGPATLTVGDIHATRARNRNLSRLLQARPLPAFPGQEEPPSPLA